MPGANMPLLLGLTGSIGMGKSTVSNMFRDQGVPVFDADEAVHHMYSKGGKAVEPIRAAFPDAVVDGAVYRPQLSKAVLGNKAALKQLEGLVHPLVYSERRQWLQQHASEGRHSVLVLDIPLLYETDAEGMVDAVAVVSAPEPVQRERVLARPGMTEERLQNILARQVPDADKRAKADFVIDTGCSKEETREHVHSLISGMHGRHGQAILKHLQAQVAQEDGTASKM
ncbi:g8304 [Coccomyxa viridis]|uniref:G8304 protein n=1 Tax=Coccomyxa viridis TaxID=1274662 RepID=A0ABP1G457_9CHLO